jgi:hypothetical protein
MDPKKGLGRTAVEQASYQVATLFTTWTIAVVGGLITGRDTILCANKVCV